jgi:hypothetical protein
MFFRPAPIKPRCYWVFLPGGLVWTVRRYSHAARYSGAWRGVLFGCFVHLHEKPDGRSKSMCTRQQQSSTGVASPPLVSFLAQHRQIITHSPLHHLACILPQPKRSPPQKTPDMVGLGLSRNGLLRRCGARYHPCSRPPPSRARVAHATTELPPSREASASSSLLPPC